MLGLIILQLYSPHIYKKICDYAVRCASKSHHTHAINLPPWGETLKNAVTVDSTQYEGYGILGVT